MSEIVTLQARLDELNRVQAMAKGISDTLKPYKDREAELRTEILQRMNAGGIGRLDGVGMKAIVRTETAWVVTDEPAVRQYLSHLSAEELAICERTETRTWLDVNSVLQIQQTYENSPIPGFGQIEKKSLVITREKAAVTE